MVELNLVEGWIEWMTIQAVGLFSWFYQKVKKRVMATLLHDWQTNNILSRFIINFRLKICAGLGLGCVLVGGFSNERSVLPSQAHPMTLSPAAPRPTPSDDSIDDDDVDDVDDDDVRLHFYSIQPLTKSSRSSK